MCIGDRYRIGEAEFEVTQPRVTCYRVGMRMGEPELPALLVAHHRPGFYLRVITEGHVQAGDEIVKTRTGPARAERRRHRRAALPARTATPPSSAPRPEIPALSPGWQESFRELLEAAENGAGTPAPAGGDQPAWAGFRPLRVTEVVRETADGVVDLPGRRRTGARCRPPGPAST